MTDDLKPTPGRPRFPEGASRDVTVRFRVRRDQRQEIEDDADEARVSVSQWIRDRLGLRKKRGEDLP